MKNSFAYGAVALIFTALSGAAGGVYLLETWNDEELATNDDVVIALDKITATIEKNGLGLNTVADGTNFSEAVSRLNASVVAETKEEIQSQSSVYARVYNGVFELNEAEGVDVEAPNGEYRTFGFDGFPFNNISRGATVYFDNERTEGFKPGMKLEFVADDRSCDLTPVNFDIEQNKHRASFRFRCRPLN